MPPMLGIMASGITGSKQSSFESIATVTAAGGETSLSFTSIPSTYKSLQIRGIARDTYTTSLTGTFGAILNFNSDTTAANYTTHTLQGNGTAAAASGSTSNGAISTYFGQTSSGSSNTSIYGANIIDIIDYSSTTKNKTVRSFSGADGNVASTAWGVSLSSGLWLSTSAITTISITKWNLAFAAGTTFALYGIKG